MLDLTVLYCGRETGSMPHRYGRALRGSLTQGEEPHRVAQTALSRRPVVVWNMTRRCFLRCVHCYSDSTNQCDQGELTTTEAKAMLADLASFKVPVVIFSGGEALMRPDFFELAAYAKEELDLRLTLSTNGILITPKVAARLKAVGFSYVGISLDGIGAINDEFRGLKGAYQLALQGIRHCQAVGQKVGLRMTLTRQNVKDLPRIFDLIESEQIPRACFYHLVPSGRGHSVAALTPPETRHAMDVILERTRDLVTRGITVEILTVDNHCDGPYLYLKVLEGERKVMSPENGTLERSTIASTRSRARQVYELLQWNGGGVASSGVGLACIDWAGNIHPDQFWMHYSFGNVRERPFSQVWSDLSDPLMAGLKNRLPYLKGRCGNCRFKGLCGGSLRVRAELATGDPWASDPACYLTDDEIELGHAPRVP
ncbi:MAG: radical SAM protein [Elusimicrobia bacterium]|nr:radical SAM protein [Elusimicrobiota bacterium]